MLLCLKVSLAHSTFDVHLNRGGLGDLPPWRLGGWAGACVTAHLQTS